MLHPTQIPLQDLDTEVVINDLSVQGQLPSWLQGTLIRNGPAKFHFGDKTISHWFDGLAMLHAFAFKQGKVSYRNKFLRSTPFFQATEKNDLHFMGFAQDPCYTLFHRLFTHFLPSLTDTIIQNANVNVMKIAGKYTALTETPLPVEFNPHTLETIAALDFKDSLLKKDCFESAHPHYDPLRKEIVNLHIDFGRKCRYTLFTASDHGEPSRKPFFSMEVDKASYMHTFAMTKRYVIIVEYPLLLNPLDLLLKNGGYITHFHWENKLPTRFHVIDRAAGKRIQTLECDPFFCFHHVNAYETQNDLIIDLISYPDAQIVFGELPPDQTRKLERFKITLDSNKIERTTIAESLLELPRIFYQKYNTKPYQYVYGVGFQYPNSPSDEISLLKINVNHGSKNEWKEKGSLAGEPVFIPRPNAQKEDDGVLLSVVSNALCNCSYLLVLDAQSLEELARAEVSQFIPYGLHGMYFHI